MTAGDPVEDYLTRVAEHLPRGARAAGEVLEELRDGLHETLEHRPSPDGEGAARHLVREFGDPRVIGAALASEMRLRLARRHALGVLLILLTTGLGWSLYEALVGVSPAAAPTGYAEPLFFAALDVLIYSVTAAQVAAGLSVVAVSLPLRGLAHSLVPALLGRATMAALLGFAGAAVAMVALMAPGHRLEGAMGGAVLTAVALTCLCATRSMVRHVDHARHARRSAA